MSHLLELGLQDMHDEQRLRDLAANDAAMLPLRLFKVQVKQGQRVLTSFDCMARSSVDAVAQHVGVADFLGGYLMVSPVGSAA